MLVSAVAGSLVLLGVAVARAGSVSAYESPEGPIVDVGYAAFLGNASVPGVHFFGGIRFVQPPLGELRWRPPAELDETPTQNKTLTDAQWFGDICLQQPAELGFGSDGESINLLVAHLCICVPRHELRVTRLLDIKRMEASPSQSRRQPPRGALHTWRRKLLRSTLVIRNRSLPCVSDMKPRQSAQGFPMATWVQGSGGNIVAVNIQYRLGLLGFLASDVLMQNGSANVGLLDQRAAIEWVRRYHNLRSVIWQSNAYC